MESHKHVTRRKIGIWQISTVVLAVVLILSIFVNWNDESSLTEQEASDKAVEYINQNLMQGGEKAEIKSITETNGCYNIKLNVNGQEFDSYISKDGKLLFPEAINLDEIKETVQQPEKVDVNVEKSDKPIIELFVMSHCPYGTQIEKGMVPVVDLLGESVDFQLKFVNYAMHGQKEIDEQLNQYCIQKEYPGEITKYLKCFLEEGKGEECIEKSDFDASLISSCVEIEDEEFGITVDYNDKSKWKGSFPPFNVYDEENKKYGVRGSPSLVINGKNVQAGRDAQSLLNAVCSTFTDKPEECNTDLSSQGSPSPGFGYREAAAAPSDAGCGG